MKQNLRRILLCAALLGLPFIPVKAYDWYPMGDSAADENGTTWAFDAGPTYAYRDVLADNAPQDIAPINQPFAASAVDYTLDIYGTLYDAAGDQVLVDGEPVPVPLKVNANVVVDASAHDMTVNILEPVIIEPYLLPPAGAQQAEAGCSQIYFQTNPIGDTVTAPHNITVNVDNDLTFRGRTSGESYQDMLLSFQGRGQVTFKMADGTTIKFDGQLDATTPFAKDAEGNWVEPCTEPSNAAGGTKVFILMDQTVADAAALKNKVLFQRKALTSGLDPDTNYQRVMVYVGYNSLITYLSTNPTGLPGELYLDGDYGSIAFDPSNNGIGRMVLFIRGAYYVDPNPYTDEEQPNPNYNRITEWYPFNDGAVVTAGHYVADFQPETISGCVLPGEGESGNPGYDFSVPAGIKATTRVLDNLFYANKPVGDYNPSADNRRGLLIVNDVANRGKFASDPTWDLYNDPETYYGVWWAYSNPANATTNVRRGCVTGVNGQWDVYHNCFIDHVSGSVNDVEPLAQCDYTNLGLLKKHNPSAFLTDGLDVALFITGNPFFDAPGNTSLFTAANPYTQAFPTAAELTLRGDGALYMRESASTLYGYLYNFFTYDGQFAYSEDALWDTELDWTWYLRLGQSAYDGYQLAPIANSVQAGEGEHVLDVEGPWSATSLRTWPLTNTDRTYASGAIVTKSGVVNAASILLDHTGSECEVEAVTDILYIYPHINRPLLADGTEYWRYNSPTFFFNNNAQFFNTIIRHSDATKYVDAIPWDSEPAMTGGERLFFANAVWGIAAENIAADPNRYRLPEFQMYDSTLELQESLNASGFRFVVKDNYGVPGVLLGSNASVVKFFDHGDPLDTMLTNFGRIFLCGSGYNLMADDSNNYVTETSIWNVYKHNAPTATDPLTTSAQVKLSFQNGNQFHPTIQALIDAEATVQAQNALREKQRAHHLFILSQPLPLETVQPCDCLPVSNMEIGWTNEVLIEDTVAGLHAPAGDAGAFPYCLPYQPPYTDINISTAINTLPEGEYPRFTSNPWLPNALTVPPAIVSLEANVLCFGSFDQNGNSISTPVLSTNADGVVYVNHGGEITTTRPTTELSPMERNSIPWQSIFATMLCNRIWNDYDYLGTTRVCHVSGIVDLPHDQVEFDGAAEKGYGVQPINISQEMFAARRADTEGYVRLDYYNRTGNPVADRSGAEEVTLGWLFRAPTDYDVPGQIPPKSARVQAMEKAFRHITRATESVNTPQTRPTDLLYVGAGDDIAQLRVAGATMSDPFLLDVAGDGVRPLAGRVREFASLKTNNALLVDHFISEGAHAVLFVEYGGRIGLGSRNWDENSVNAWNLLGKDYVTICPLGDGYVDLNANLYVTDKLALVATDYFGWEDVNRLTFYSEAPYEIRIPKGGELDLSSFGQGVHRQEIAFGGHVKLIIEEGATIRLPDPSAVVGGLVLYFNDQSQLIFEGAKDQTVFIPFTDAYGNEFNNGSAPIADSRIKILGKGQIWLNKDARMTVMGNTFVGVETDVTTPNTDLTISIQRQGGFYIGDENLSGGAFQVGDVAPIVGVDHSVNFQLILNGPDAIFHIDREGFFGLGAGVINKNGNPNGKDATADGNPAFNDDGTAATNPDGTPVFNPLTDPWMGEWQVQRLYNVNNVTIEVAQGIIEHKNIYDGSSNQASLWAIGPAASYAFKLNGFDDASVRGGGNVMYVPVTATAAAPIFVNIWDYAGPLHDGEEYSILASGPLMLDRVDFVASARYGFHGRMFYGLPAESMFELLAFRPFADQPHKKIDLSATQFASLAAYTNNNAAFNANTNVLENKYGNVANGALISRILAPTNIAGGGTLVDAQELGALGATADANGIPTGFSIIK